MPTAVPAHRKSFLAIAPLNPLPVDRMTLMSQQDGLATIAQLATLLGKRAHHLGASSRIARSSDLHSDHGTPALPEAALLTMQMRGVQLNVLVVQVHGMAK